MYAVGFEHLAAISGEDAEQLDRWFEALLWMITVKESTNKLGTYHANLLGRLMLGKLARHSKASDRLTAILTPEYCQRWNTWAGPKPATLDPAAAGGSEQVAAAATAVVLPVGERMLAMIEDVREQLSQQLGHKMDHRRKAADFAGINPDDNKPYATPSGVMGRAKVLHQLVVRAKVKDLPESNFAWRMVDLLGDMFPMHNTDLGCLIRNHVMVLGVAADDLTLTVVSELADKFYDTWRTYDNSVDKTVARGATPAGSYHSGHGTGSGDEHSDAEDCERPQQPEQPCVNAVAGWAPNPNAAPSEAGTVISMADLRSVLQEMGVSRGATPAVNAVQQQQQHQPNTSAAPSVASTVMISMADLRTVLKDWGY